MRKPNYILKHPDKDPIKVHMQTFLYIFYADSININTRSRDDGSLLCMHTEYADAHQATKYTARLHANNSTRSGSMTARKYFFLELWQRYMAKIFAKMKTPIKSPYLIYGWVLVLLLKDLKYNVCAFLKKRLSMRIKCVYLTCISTDKK
jgi:hypothetical protein